MKDSLTIYFSTKKIVMNTLLALLASLISLLAIPIIAGKILSGELSILFISSIVIMTYASLYLLHNTIYLFFKTILKREKEAVIINDKGIYRSKCHIFSKPILIDWKNIDVFSYEYHDIDKRRGGRIRIRKQNHPIWIFFNDNSICLNLKQEFYDNLSIMDKIACHLTSITSKGYNFRIKLFFTKCDAKEVTSKMKEYRSTK